MTSASDIGPVVEQARNLLAGKPPELQGAVLADLLAIWLASHLIPGNPRKTDSMRNRLLHMHIAQVRKLIPPNAAIMHGPRTEP